MSEPKDPPGEEPSAQSAGADDKPHDGGSSNPARERPEHLRPRRRIDMRRPRAPESEGKETPAIDGSAAPAPNAAPAPSAPEKPKPAEPARSAFDRAPSWHERRFDRGPRRDRPRRPFQQSSFEDRDARPADAPSSASGPAVAPRAEAQKPKAEAPKAPVEKPRAEAPKVEVKPEPPKPAPAPIPLRPMLAAHPKKKKPALTPKEALKAKVQARAAAKQAEKEADRRASMDPQARAEADAEAPESPSSAPSPASSPAPKAASKPGLKNKNKPKPAPEPDLEPEPPPKKGLWQRLVAWFRGE